MWQKWRKKWRELVISQYRGSAPGLFAPLRTTCCLLDPCGWEIRITSNTARVIDWVKHLIPIARRPPWLSPPLGSLRGHSRVTLLAWWSTQFVNFGALQGNDIGRIGVPDLPFATTFTLVCYDQFFVWLAKNGRLSFVKNVSTRSYWLLHRHHSALTPKPKILSTHIWKLYPVIPGAGGPFNDQILSESTMNSPCKTHREDMTFSPFQSNRPDPFTGTAGFGTLGLWYNQAYIWIPRISLIFFA